MTRTIAEKMGVEAGTRAIILDAPAGVVEALDLPPLDRKTTLSGTFAYIYQFATTQADLERQFRRLSAHLAPGGMLWVSWPKRKQLDTDLTLQRVIGIGYDHGLVESKTIGVDAT
jgi:hypothetical protein